MLCSDPPTAVRKHFKQLGRYLLPETFVKGRVVSLVLDDNVIVGAPVYIEDTLYDRNCFQFNICMVISSRVDTEPHLDLAQHLATAFHALEVEIKLLSQPDEVQRVQSVLQNLRAQLNVSDGCFVRVDESRCVAFRVRPWRPALTSELHLSEVPLPLVDLAGLLEGGSSSSSTASGYDGGFRSNSRLPFEPDLTLMHLVPLINGVHSIQDIIDSCSLDEDRTLICISHLLHFGLIAVIDAIQLKSRYCLTPDFHTAFDRPEVCAGVVRYVTAGQRPLLEDESEIEVGSGEARLIDVVQGLYAKIDGWRNTVGEFQQANASELNTHEISLRHFITFGLLSGFLEVIDSYTQALSPDDILEVQTLRSSTIPQLKRMLKEKGMSSEEVNKDTSVRNMVARMNELKAKEKQGQRAIATDVVRVRNSFGKTIACIKAGDALPATVADLKAMVLGAMRGSHAGQVNLSTHSRLLQDTESLEMLLSGDYNKLLELQLTKAGTSPLLDASEYHLEQGLS